MSENDVIDTDVEQLRSRLLGEIRAARDASANGTHTPGGKFAAGNPGGPGNPHAGQVAKLRAVMLAAVTEDDMRAVTRKLVEMALEGDLKAVDLLFQRTLGKVDAGPLVALQVNQPSNGPGESPGRAAAIAARLNAARQAATTHDGGSIASAIIARVLAERGEGPHLIEGGTENV